MSLRLGGSSNLEPRPWVSHTSCRRRHILSKTPIVHLSRYQKRCLQSPYSRIHPYRHDFEKETFTTHVVSRKLITMANVVEGHNGISPKLITMANVMENYNGKDVYHLGMVVERSHESRHAYSLSVPGSTLSNVMKAYVIHSKGPTSNDVPTSRRKRFL